MNINPTQQNMSGFFTVDNYNFFNCFNSLRLSINATPVMPGANVWFDVENSNATYS